MSSIYTHLYSEELYLSTQDVTVVLAKPWDNYSREDKTLLSKILGSVKLNTASVRIVSQPTLALGSLSKYSPSKVIIFGSHSSNLKTYETTSAQGFTVLMADDLPQLDDAKKKSLWLALKTMFSI